MVTADHGPAVSGAHNTIVTTRAGKDLVSSLVSGLLTIGPRFGGALDDAASMFTDASDNGSDPEQFVKDMRKANKVRIACFCDICTPSLTLIFLITFLYPQLIMGIGHRIKSLTNPDKRCEIIKDFAMEHFKDNTILKFALAVEQGWFVVSSCEYYVIYSLVTLTTSNCYSFRS